MRCDGEQVWAVRYQWYAIDDNRIQVINKLNDVNFQNQTIDHQNPNAAKGFISIISLSYKGPFSFNISISSITPSNVSINFTDPLSQMGNILSLGYQIILALPEQLTFLDTVRNTGSWSSPSIPIIVNNFFMIPLFGYEYPNADNIRLNVTYSQGSKISYKLENWAPYTISSHKQIYLLLSFNQTYLPLFCNHFEVIQKVDPSTTQLTSVTMLVLETNQQFSYGQYSLFLDKSLSTINFEITVRCYSTQSVQSSFYIYVSQAGSTQQNQYLHSCSSQYSIITYYVRLKQQTTAIEQLQIEITPNSITITQIYIRNQINVSQQQLVAIQLFDL